jgi:hypothetical protein
MASTNLRVQYQEAVSGAGIVDIEADENGE